MTPGRTAATLLDQAGAAKARARSIEAQAMAAHAECRRYAQQARAAGCTLDQIADALCVTRQAVSKYLNPKG